MLPRNRTNDQLVALFVLGALLFLPPLLFIFSQPVRVLGIPVLYLFLFLVWAALIGITAAVVRRIEIAQSSNGASSGPGRSERQSDA